MFSQKHFQFFWIFNGGDSQTLVYLFELERKESRYRSAGQMVGWTLSGRGSRADWEDPNVVAVVGYEVGR